MAGPAVVHGPVLLVSDHKQFEGCRVDLEKAEECSGGWGVGRGVGGVKRAQDFLWVGHGFIR